MDIGFFPMQTRGNYTIFINRKAGNYCRVVVINNLMQFHYFGSSALCAKNGKRIAGPPVQSSLNPA